MLETEREGRQRTGEQLHEEFPGNRKHQLTVKCSIYWNIGNWIYFSEVKKKNQPKKRLANRLARRQVQVFLENLLTVMNTTYEISRHSETTGNRCTTDSEITTAT